MKFLDLFAGIGGFRLGMEAAGHECVGFVEWDKHARKSYEAIHDTKGEWTAHDITKVTDDEWRELKGKAEIICGGFPCQAFSIAGDRRGFEDTRGTLFFEIVRAAKQIQPEYLILENVKGLLSSKTQMSFENITEILNQEILRGTLWEEEFSQMNNWNTLNDNIAHYLAEKLQTNLIYQNLKLDTLSRKNLKLVYEMTEKEVENGLMKRLKYLITQILQITKKQSYFPIELMQQLDYKEEEWVLNLKKLHSIDSLKVVDISTLEKMVVINGEIEKLLNKKSEEDLRKGKLFTISTESKQMIDRKICTFVQEVNILLFIIKQWRLSTNLWEKVMSNLMKKKGDMYYVPTFNIIVSMLAEIGYDTEWELLNSKYFGVPQNRERLFIIGHLRGSSTRKIFPIRRNAETANTQGDGTRQIIIQGMLDIKGKDQVKRIYNPKGLSPTLTTMQGGHQEPKIAVVKKIDIPQIVTVRKYQVDKEKLTSTLRHHKKKTGLTNKKIAEKLAIPITKVEHWFREDNSFAIPEKEIWIDLKKLLEIESNYFDDSIMIFEEKEGVFEKANRHYFSDGLAPTLTSTSAGNEKIILNNNLTELKIRKLTPKECWRLQGFPDSAFEKAEKVNSNSQLYKQAGNSVTVNVVREIAKKLK